MSSDRNLQISFLDWIKQNVDFPNSFAEDVADLLSISKDSSYRRIRGESLLSFEEIKKLSEKYKVSLDAFLNLNADTVLFNIRTVNNDSFTIKDYLTSIKNNLDTISQFKEKKIIYAAKDIPVFHYYQFPALTRFKMFFWLRAIIGSSDHQQNKYEPERIDTDLVSIAHDIWQKYMVIPSSEIWSRETMNITLRQLEYYNHSGFLAKEQVKEIIKEFLEMINLIRSEARLGKKILIGNENSGIEGSYNLFFNEIAISDNTIFFMMDEHRMVFKAYNMLNLLNTSDEQFCQDNENYLNNIIKKSIPLSLNSEKERNRFFNRIEKRVKKLSKKLVS